MGSRAIQLALIVALGVGVGLLISRPWSSSTESPAPAVAAPTATEEPASRPAVEPSSATTSPSEPAQPRRPFKLPAMTVASAAPQVVIKQETAKPEAPPILVPKDWVLRGTGSEHYDASSDKSEVLSGQYSVRFAAHDKNVAYTEFASLMQSVVAEPWLGKRVVFSLSWKGRGLVQDVEVWIRALDAGRVVIAHNNAGSRYSKPEWKKSTVAIDVPWSAAEITYGVNLRATGGAWVDAAKLDAVDRNAAVGARNLPGELGVIAQESTANGPLAMPSNMDFEDVGPATDAFRRAPKDQLGRSRF
jgi:hypothetical protein